MRFRELFQLFSRRTEARSPPAKALTQEFRARVLMRCRDSFSGSGYLDEFWEQIHEKLAYLLGRPRLSTGAHRSRAEDVIAFLRTCDDEHFLDFVELIFRTEVFFRAHERETFVGDVNDFLSVDGLPYTITDFVWTTGTVTHFGREYEGTTLTEYPRVIRKDSEFLHKTAIAPALAVLSGAEFRAANAEFLEALEDYRRKDFGDCLTKCGSAFESVMKVMCHRNGWPYRQEDTASTLLRTVLKNNDLESFMEQPLIIIATLRNRLSKSHGGGAKPRQTPRELAEYAINATASAVLLLTRATP